MVVQVPKQWPVGSKIHIHCCGVDTSATQADKMKATKLRTKMLEAYENFDSGQK